MIFSELAFRYASALFSAAKDVQKTDEYFQSLRVVEKACSSDSTLTAFISSPLVRSEEKEKIFKSIFEKDTSLQTDVGNFILLLAKKGRLQLLPQIVAAYRAKLDEALNLRRGVVHSATELSDTQKKDVQNHIGKVLNKNIELTFEADNELIGGMTVQVGSLRFDDALSSHLNKIKEDLTRRIN